METIYKVLENCEVKKLGERQYEFTASTADIDRDGEVIDVLGWDLRNFKKNPVIMYAHDYRSLPVGKATRVGVKDGKLMNTVEFPPEGTYEFADIVERLVNTGYLKTESVGFIPKKWEDGDFDDEKGNKPRRTYTKQELLEISIVPVPSNPNALMNAVKEGVITTKQFKAITEGEPEIIEGKEIITKPEEDDEFIRIPVRDCKVTATIDISKKEGISALYCGKEKQVRTYLFRKDKGWTMSKAKAWVKEHEGKSVIIAEVSQAEILDELDYIIRLLETEGMNADVEKDAWNLMEELLRLTGGEIPDNIKALIKEVSPIVEAKPDTKLEQSDISDAIKRIAKSNMEDK